MTTANDSGFSTAFDKLPPCEPNVSTLPGQEQLAVSRDRTEDTHDWNLSANNPRNWSAMKKWTTTILIAFYTLIPPLASSMMSSGLPDVALKYDITNPTILSLTFSIFLLSFSVGPLFLSPLSEMYGRIWVLHISNLVFLCFNLGCALAPNTNALIAFRFLSGFAGSAPLAIGCGSISDLFAEEERASAMALYTLGPLMGPVAGPIMGGFISQSIGVQYIFYLIVGLSGVASILAIPLLRETYAPVVRRRLHAQGAELEKGNITIRDQDQLRYISDNLKRPIILLTRSFICFILSLYSALVAGIFYLMFATFPNLFAEVYHFSVGISGLAYIGLGVGFVVAAIFGARISDQIYLHLAAKNGSKGKPEMRIPSLIFGSLLAPIGLFWYGWSAQARIHWIMPIIGTAIYGFSLLFSFLSIQLYLVDAFVYSASALAAASFFRYILAFAFPLFGDQMYAKLGYGSGNSLLAGLAIVIGIPFPIWIYYKGERIRASSPLSS